jgi:hypothetical protein
MSDAGPAPPAEPAVGPSGPAIVKTSAEIQAGRLGHDAPLQIRRSHKVPYSKHTPWTTRFLGFLRRNWMPICFGTFVYVEFFGFPIARTTAQDNKRVITLRRRFDNKVVAGCEYQPPAKPSAPLERVGAFSIIDKTVASKGESLMPSSADRPPFRVRASEYLQSFFPNPFFNKVNSATYSNGLQYNWLLYYVQDYAERKATFLPVDAITKDETVAVHVALKVVFRPETIVIAKDNPGHPFVGLSDAMLDRFAKEEVEKWVRIATGHDIRIAPLRRLNSSRTESLASMTEAELRASVDASTLAHRRYVEEVDEAERRMLAAAEAGTDVVPERTPIQPPVDALGYEETLRRIWVANMLARTKGKVVIEDLLWKMTVTDLMVADPNTPKDPSLSSSWQF